MDWLQQLVDESSALSELVDRRREALARASGQSRARWQILVTLFPGDLTVPQIARRLRVTRQSVQRIADRLSEEGLIRFVTNPDHRRSSRLTLTDHGRDLGKRLERGENDWKEGIAEHLETEDLETALYTLRALRDSL
jgi:DNA-binding MarR family transcriptional regulator